MGGSTKGPCPAPGLLFEGKETVTLKEGEEMAVKSHWALKKKSEDDFKSEKNVCISRYIEITQFNPLCLAQDSLAAISER